MLKIGNENTLIIARAAPPGLYLSSDEGEILLPNRYVTPEMAIGQELTVFVYTDSEDRLVGATETPHAQVGDFAALLVKEVTRVGTFLDWGLPKDLLLPYKEQLDPVRAGQRLVVRVVLDPRTNRVMATEKFQPFFTKDISALTEKQKVTLLVYRETDLGYKVIINQQYDGLVFHNDIFEAIAIGDTKTGHIKQLRQDGKIDVSLQPIGILAGMDAAQTTVLQKLTAAGGQLPYHDKSDPETIQDAFGLSKKAFKRAIGGLYQDKKIVLEEGGIRLV